jgi:nickel-dependent lactate racemase
LQVPCADAFEGPAHLRPLADPDGALAAALAQPLGAQRLRDIARCASSVTITIPDASRPCPTEAILDGLLLELEAAGVAVSKIKVLIGCGLHASTTDAARRSLVGEKVAGRISIRDAHGIHSRSVDLGVTSQGCPVTIVKDVVDADLTVTVGVVEPHLYAGFSGGVKGVAIGCAGADTIAWTHRPSFVSRDGVALGRLERNPFCETLGEIAATTTLGWGVNVVMSERGEPAAFAAGDPALIQKALAESHGGEWFRSVNGPFDVLIAGIHPPKSDNFYQASRAATYAASADKPALAEGGLIVLCADLPDGAGLGPGERNFLHVLAASSTPDELVARGLREPLGPGGQRSFVVAQVLRRFGIGVVGARDPAFLAPLARLGIASFPTVDAAVAHAEAGLGRGARVLAVADAMSTVPRDVAPRRQWGRKE